MTALVFGATGFVGREVVKQLGDRGVAHVRPDSSKLDEWKQTFAVVDTTPWDKPALAAMMRERKPSQIYVLIGTTRGRAKAEEISGDIYEAIDLGLTQLAVEAAVASETKPRIVYLSSVGADVTATSAYLRARGKAEDVVMTSGLPWVIARPSIITGEREDGRIGERSAAIVGDGLLAVAGVLGGKSLRDKYRSTTPDVLATALIRIADAPEHDRIVDGADLR
jgi:NADH dehydrogenase